MSRRLYLKYYISLVLKTLVPGWAIIFLFCALFSLTYELILINIVAPISWFSGIGRFTIQVSYGYIAGYIFYFLTVHIPSLDKKIHLYRFMNNSIAHLHRIIESIYQKCPKPEKGPRTAIEIKKWLKEIVPLNRYYEGMNGGIEIEYPTFYSFLLSKRELINAQIEILMNHQDIFSFNTIKNLTHIYDGLNKLDFITVQILVNKDAEILSFCLDSIPLYINEIWNDLNVGKKEYHRLNLLINKKEMDNIKAAIYSTTPEPGE